MVFTAGKRRLVRGRGGVGGKFRRGKFTPRRRQMQLPVNGMVPRGINTSTDVARFKIKFTGNVVSDATGTISFVTSLSDPEQAFNGAGTYNDYNNLLTLYDLYKPTGVKVQYFPDKPNDTSINTGYKPLFIVKDVDSASQQLTSRNTAIQYDKLLIKNLYRPWSVFYRSPSNTASTQNGGYFNIASASPHGTGAIMFYADGVDTSDDYGTFILTMWIVCKGRR